MKLRIALFILSVAAMAAFGLFTQAKADGAMVYGLGTETCRQSLTHDWLTTGEVAWVAGYMSYAAWTMPAHELDPGAASAKRLVAIVYKQCKFDPSKTLAETAGLIVVRIREHQKAAEPVQVPNAELEGAF